MKVRIKEESIKDLELHEEQVAKMLIGKELDVKYVYNFIGNKYYCVSYENNTYQINGKYCDIIEYDKLKTETKPKEENTLTKEYILNNNGKFTIVDVFRINEVHHNTYAISKDGIEIYIKNGKAELDKKLLESTYTIKFEEGWEYMESDSYTELLIKISRKLNKGYKVKSVDRSIEEFYDTLEELYGTIGEQHITNLSWYYLKED